MVTQTRFKVVLIGLALGLIEGALAVVLKGFPTIEVFGFQGALIGYYFTVKTVSGVKYMQAGTDKVEAENGCGQ
jgi:hypothetical protein